MFGSFLVRVRLIGLILILLWTSLNSFLVLMLSMLEGGGGYFDFFARVCQHSLYGIAVIALRDRDVVKVSLNTHAVKVEKFFIGSLTEPATFLHVYVSSKLQDQLAVPTDMWIPLGCFMTTHCRQSLLSSARDKDYFVSGTNSAPRRASGGILDED
jgi:hypothetical protein